MDTLCFDCSPDSRFCAVLLCLLAAFPMFSLGQIVWLVLVLNLIRSEGRKGLGFFFPIGIIKVAGLTYCKVN